MPPPRRPGDGSSGCSTLRLITTCMLGTALVWLLMGALLFSNMASQQVPPGGSVLQRTELMAGKILEAEAAAMRARLLQAEAAASQRLRGAESAFLRRPPPYRSAPAAAAAPAAADDATVADHAAMGHEFGAAARAAAATTPPPERAPPAQGVAAVVPLMAAPAAYAVAAPAAYAAAPAAFTAAAAPGIGSSSLAAPAAASSLAHVGWGGAWGGYGHGTAGWDQAAYDALPPWRAIHGEAKLPPFWQPPPTVDLDDTGYDVEGQPTIFLMVASYRDFQCRDTIASALSRAAYPARVVVAAVQQNAVDGDEPGCAEPPKPCAQDPAQPVCARANQIRLFKVNALDATGPVFARHVGDRMYRGETYAMQLDAHVTFIQDWDLLMVSQFFETKNDMAVLSTYLTDVQGSITADGHSKRKTRPIMCNSHFEGGGQTAHLRHLAQPEEVAALQTTPMLQPFWAAGMSFSRGHFVTRVPYDCCLPMLFQGEEISIGIRAWTFGYDLYAPHTSVIFHEYAVNSARRRGVHSFWENRGANDPSAAMRRMVAIIRMAPGIDPKSWDHKDEAKYGLGTARRVDDFYRIFGMDVHAKKVVEGMCKWVKSGELHKTFVGSLRPNGKGIDYSSFADYSGFQAVKALLKGLSTAMEVRLHAALAKNKVAALTGALDEAKRTLGVDGHLLEEARAALAKLKK